MYIPKNRVFWSVSLGHMTNDIFMSMGPVLLAFIGAVYFPISPAQLGVAVSAQQLLGGISQPLFGWLSDKGSSRLLGAGGVAWTVSFLMLSLFFALMGQFWLMVIPFALTALGSGAFHPVGTAFAAHDDHEHATSDTAYFFLFGQTGLALGPALAGYLLGLTQINGEGGNIYPIFILGLIAIPAVIFMRMTIPGNAELAARNQAEEEAAKSKPVVQKGPTDVRSIVILALLITLRGFAYPGSMAFVPVMFQERGWSPGAYGSIAAAFSFSSAIAGVLFSYLADRFNPRYVTGVTLLLGASAFYFIPDLNGALAFLFVIIAGMLIGGSHSIIIVMAQGILPGKKAFTSGVSLGFMFGIGALCTLVIGYMAEGVGQFSGLGLSRVFHVIAGVVVVAGVLGFFLPAYTPSRTVSSSLEQTELKPGAAD